ncbi:hypothetical protein ACA910_018635 [Epithemia clementina (nom. ined.)]
MSLSSSSFSSNQVPDKSSSATNNDEDSSNSNSNKNHHHHNHNNAKNNNWHIVTPDDIVQATGNANANSNSNVWSDLLGASLHEWNGTVYQQALECAILFCSFNGGKDACVILELMQAAHAKYHNTRMANFLKFWNLFKT